MNDFINKVQKELNKLQKTLEKEGEVMMKKIKTRAAKAETKVSDRKKDISVLIDKQLQKFEPAVEKFYKELKTSAGKYGIDLTDIESKVKSTTRKAAKSLNLGTKKKKTKKKVTKKNATAKKKTAKSTTPKKASAKKVASKKTAKTSK